MKEDLGLEVEHRDLTHDHWLFMDEVYRLGLKKGFIPEELMGVLAHMIGHLIGISKIPEQARGFAVSMLASDMITGIGAYDKVTAKKASSEHLN